MNSSMKIYLSFIICAILSSCSSRALEQSDIVSEWKGREINFQGDYSSRIQEQIIDLDTIFFRF